MKNKIISIIVVIGLMFSCSLDETIYDTPSPSNFLVTSTDLGNLIGGMYSVLYTPPLFKGQVHNMLEAPTDYLVTTAGGSKVTLAQKNYSTSQAEFQYVWTDFYKIIANANQLLSVVDEMDLSPAEYNANKGQGHFLRAFCYFNLVRFFGEIPLYTEPTTSETDFYKGKSSVDEIYQLILTDFKTASDLLAKQSKQPSSEAGRATRGTAQAYYALANLTYGNYLTEKGKNANTNYGLAKTYSDSIILSNEYSLVPDFATLWNTSKEKESYKEVIFGLRFTVDGSVTGNSSKGSSLAHYFNPAQEPNVAGNQTWKGGFGHYKVQAWFYDFCTTGDYVNDYRSEVSFKTSFLNRANNQIRITYPETNITAGGVEDYPYIKKYLGPTSQNQNDENDLFLIRLAEVFLIKAEAINELEGPSIEAQNAFNKLRERARLANGVTRLYPSNINVSGMTKEQFRMAIFNERGIELMAEGHRWFDLVRMKSPDGKSMYEYMLNYVRNNFIAGKPVFNTSTKKWSLGRYEASHIPAFSNRFLLFPIPANEMAINPKMQPNNPGW